MRKGVGGDSDVESVEGWIVVKTEQLSKKWGEADLMQRRWGVTVRLAKSTIHSTSKT